LTGMTPAFRAAWPCIAHYGRAARLIPPGASVEDAQTWHGTLRYCDCRPVGAMELDHLAERRTRVASLSIVFALYNFESLPVLEGCGSPPAVYASEGSDRRRRAEMSTLARPDRHVACVSRHACEEHSQPA
jgi:hypothetical protein